MTTPNGTPGTPVGDGDGDDVGEALGDWVTVCVGDGVGEAPAADGATETSFESGDPPTALDAWT
jgi:hypothetical protein